MSGAVEELHGVTAMIHRSHPDIGEDVLVSRAQIRYIDHMAQTATITDKEIKRELGRQTRWENKQPYRVNGRNVFIGKFMKEAKRLRKEGAGKGLGRQGCRKALSKASMLYDTLAPEVRAYYDGVAEQLAKIQQTQRELAKLESSLTALISCDNHSIQDCSILQRLKQSECC